MIWADLFIVFVCVASAAFGFWRGFVKEALSLVTWLAAIWLAWRFTWLVEPFLGEWIAAPELKIWTARVILFVIAVVAGGLVAWFARAVIRHSGLGGTDRALGGVFGFARGVLIVGLLVMALEFSGAAANPWWQEARLRPVGNRVAAGIRYYAELGGRYIQEQDVAGSAAG